MDITQNLRTLKCRRSDIKCSLFKNTGIPPSRKDTREKRRGGPEKNKTIVFPLKLYEKKREERQEEGREGQRTSLPPFQKDRISSHRLNPHLDFVAGVERTHPQLDAGVRFPAFADVLPELLDGHDVRRDVWTDEMRVVGSWVQGVTDDARRRRASRTRSLVMGSGRPGYHDPTPTWIRHFRI